MARPNPKYASWAFRAALRETIWLLTTNHVQGDRRNILLFATRRGGSTFAMELIGANRGVRPLNQPLETQSPNLTLAQSLELPRFDQGQITSLEGAAADRMRAVMNGVFTGRMVINAPTRFWQPGFDWRSDRLVLKITDAKPVIGWFDDEFDVQIVYLTRHPIPQALSCIRNRWTLTAGAHLRDPVFVERWLDDRALARAHDVMASGSELEQFVLNWGLENIAPMRLIPDRPDWTRVRYEDCVRDPAGTLELLSDRLGLDDFERMQRVVSKPSQSARLSTAATREDIEAGRGAAMVERWRDGIDEQTVARCYDVLADLGIEPDGP